MHVYVWLSPFAVHLKPTILLIVIPEYRTKSLKFEKKKKLLKIKDS